MNIELHVTSLELSKKLHELGVKQESLFYHHWYKKNRDYEDIRHTIENKRTEWFDDGKWEFRCYSAFTVSELLELLPSIEGYSLIVEIMDHGIYIGYQSNLYSGGSIPSDIRSDGKNLLKELTEMLIYLKENNLC